MYTLLKSKNIARAAPKPAPADAPSISGEAIGFWKTPWYEAPAADRQAPTRTESITLGSLTFQIAASIWFVQNLPALLSKRPKILFPSIPSNSFCGTGYLPREKESRIQTVRKTANNVWRKGHLVHV